jgi:Flp pilus assembly protein TadD
VPLIMGAAAFWVLVTPDNPISARFRGRISDTDARVIIGPFPLEDDFQLLRAHQVRTVVSLLDPDLPYERVLIERERGMAQRYGMRFLDFPMSSLLGRRFGAHYDSSALAAAGAISEAEGKVYLHCYLGLHRVRSVREVLASRGTASGTYAHRKPERKSDAVLIERARDEYDAGRFAAALQLYSGMPKPDARSRTMEGWCQFRLGAIDAARAAFENARKLDPANVEPAQGLGYCALRENRLEAAEQEFNEVLRREPGHAGALAGLGFTSFRRARLAEAAQFFKRSLHSDPNNIEARTALESIHKTGGSD